MSETIDTASERDQLQQQIKEARARLEQLQQKQRFAKLRQYDRRVTKQKRRVRQAAAIKDNPQPDWVIGARNIGALLGMTESQIYFAFAEGTFGDCLFKLSHKRLVGVRSKLLALADRLAADNPKPKNR
jgi:hypothetical protein